MTSSFSLPKPWGSGQPSANVDEVPVRSAVPVEYTWNAPSVFPTIEAWEAEMVALQEIIPTITRFQNRLREGASTLVEALQARQEILERIQIVFLYPSMEHAVDANNQAAASQVGRARSLFSQFIAAQSYIEPEILNLGEPLLRSWIQATPELQSYAHYFDNLLRKAPHVRSSEVEELLGMLSDPFSGPDNLWGLLTNADFIFKPAVTHDGKEMPLTQGTLNKYLASPDRELRRSAFENYHSLYLAYKNTLASNLVTSIKKNVFLMRARHHSSTLEAVLFENDIPVEVFYNLIDTFRRHLPTWHRYWELRRKVLGLATLRHYDIWAPLTPNSPVIPYSQAVDMICDGLAPLGPEYVATLRDGCLNQRWVDVYPNQGKSSGAFSSGVYGTHPFIVMSYTDNTFSMSTLAHELGHSMHSYLTWKHQPFPYSDYSLFVAETASNFHQAMVRAHLLQTQTDPAFQISLIEEAMNNFHRYFLLMPSLARFELELHQRVERGQTPNAVEMNELMADLLSEAYGPAMTVDRQLDGVIWSTFPHLYEDYYVYQYATGISGAYALSQRILSGQPGAVEDYLNFLKAGGSLYPLDALRKAGVDLTSPQPVEAAFGVLARLVDRLEGLLLKSG